MKTTTAENAEASAVKVTRIYSKSYWQKKKISFSEVEAIPFGLDGSMGSSYKVWNASYRKDIIATHSNLESLLAYMTKAKDQMEKRIIQRDRILKLVWGK
jgi:hypothetical protein